MYLYSLKGEQIGQLTDGEYDVSEIVAVDDENNLLYYMSTEDSPLERHLYRVKLDGTKKTKLSKEAGWHEVNFSSNCNYYIYLTRSQNCSYILQPIC